MAAKSYAMTLQCLLLRFRDNKMVYAVVNFFLAAILIWLAIYVDQKSSDTMSNPLINMSVLLSVCAITIGLTLLASLYLTDRLTVFLGKVFLILLGSYTFEFCMYCVLFPENVRNKYTMICRSVFNMFIIWYVFTKVTSVSITPYLGFWVESTAIFNGSLTNYLPYTWYNAYMVVMEFIVPTLCIVIMLLRSETTTSRLNHQKAIFNALALVSFWVTSNLLSMASRRVPLFATFVIGSFAIANAILILSSLRNVIYDFISITGSILKVIISYVIPSLFVGVMFHLLWPFISQSTVSFIVPLVLVVIVALFMSYQLTKLFNRRSGFRSRQYAQMFEQDLAKVDYNVDPEQIVAEMKNVFKRNIGMSYMSVLVDNGNEVLESVYDEEGSKQLSISVKNKLFDAVLNQNRTILFKEDVNTRFRYSSIKDGLKKLFDETDSNAIILLNEGRHVIAAIVLGERIGGNVYTDYDYTVFTKLYSYLFVFGYYMKNIANQTVVGTVNREIRMSSQIIESIQENMDHIRSQKIDTGHLMVHAHNIGGEFIDLIRLGEDKHVFVLGDLSGKGISASMSMVIVKSVIRTYLNETKDFKTLVIKVNEFIRFNLPKGTFFEGVFGLIDFSTNTMYYINCGVPAFFLFSRSYNNVIEIQGDGRVLGFVKDISPFLKVKKVSLNPGDIVVACSDGIVDSKSLRGEAFGKNRIQKSIIENSILPAAKIAQYTYDKLVDFLSKELDDDVSLLVLKCQG